MPSIIVSACLAGINCRYDGGTNLNPKIAGMVESGLAVAVCPEQLGGLSTPRPPAEISGGTGKDVIGRTGPLAGLLYQSPSPCTESSSHDPRGSARVLTIDGDDVTEAFIKGAVETLKIAKMIKASKAILKERSPSCGTMCIYDGTHSGKLVKGEGVTSALLRANGIEVVSDESL